MAHVSASSESTPTFVRLGPPRPSLPVVLSIPHAGRDYSERLLDASRLTQHHLESLEDRYVDTLSERAIEAGATAIIARRPRVEIDLNRDEREIDPSIITPPPPSRAVIASARTRGGLGVIPTRISGAGAIWHRPISSIELFRRISEIHRPYHAALAEVLKQVRAGFGIAILLDCHSMPPRPERSAPQADVVFGDLHGATIAAELLDAAVQASRAAGFLTACNMPYAGGFITARHGRPAENIHALQIEIDRALYLSDDMRSPGPGFERCATMLAGVTQSLAARALEYPQAIAAE